MHTFWSQSKLPVDVNVSLYGCLSLFVSPVMTWQPVKGISSHPVSAGIGSSTYSLALLLLFARKCLLENWTHMCWVFPQQQQLFDSYLQNLLCATSCETRNIGGITLQRR